MLRWVLLACVAALACTESPPVEIPVDIAKYAIFLANSSAQETTTFTLEHTVIKITKHSAAESSALAAKRRVPRIIVTDAAAKGLVCVGGGRVQVTPGGKVIDVEEVHTGGSSHATATAHGSETKKSEDIVVGQGDGVVVSVSASASASGDGAASAAAVGGKKGVAVAAAATGDASASAAAGDHGAATSAATGGGSSHGTATTGDHVDVHVSGGGEASGYAGGESTHVDESGKITHVDERFCTCVPDYLCDDEGYINTAGAGLIDIRSFTKTSKPKTWISKCKVTETCCKHRDNEQIGWLPSGCGDRSPILLDRRVVGGEASGLGRFPWMVAIIRSVPGADDQYVCGGSLIRDNVVLTGAHCVNKLRHERLIVRAGEWDTCNDDELYPHIDLEVIDIQVHEAFDPHTLYNDVALLTLSQHIDVSPHINTICLPDAEHSTEIHLDECVATGWGKESFDHSQYTNFLKEVPLKVVGHDACENALRTTRLGKWFKLHDTFTCAGGEPHVDTCKGDGGSPLVCRIPAQYPEEERFVQVGIVAWGIGCGKDGIPGVYADVQKLLPWIESHLTHEEAYP